MILFFDTETTGLPNPLVGPSDANQARLAQLGAVIYDSKLETEVYAFKAPIKPDGWVMKPEAEAVHGLSQQYLEEFGIDLKQVTPVFKRMCDVATKHIAHNYKFDSLIMGYEFKNTGILHVWDDNKDFCTMLRLTNVCCLPKKRGKGFKWPKLKEAYFWLFGREPEYQHDALGDVRATVDIYRELMKRGLIQY